MKQPDEQASNETLIYIYIKQPVPTHTLLNKVSDRSRKYVFSDSDSCHWCNFALRDL